MWVFSAGSGLVGIALLAALGGAQPAAALTMKECAAKYKAARASGTLGGSTWQEFRKASCGQTLLRRQPHRLEPGPQL